MSSTLNDTKKTVIHGVETVQAGAEHTFASTVSAIVKGVSAVSSVMAVLRSLDRDDGLAWFGLARRRPLRSAAIFGAGVAAGAGIGLFMAPMSGADLRRALLGHAGDSEGGAKARAAKEHPAVDGAATNGSRVNVSEAA
jgi:hypothetical protein